MIHFNLFFVKNQLIILGLLRALFIKWKKAKKNPDAIIYGHQVREYLFDYFSNRYNNLHIFDRFNFCAGALIKAKIMAGKTKQINAMNLLGRKLKLFVGKNEISHFEQYQTVPVVKVLRVKKNANDLVLKVSFNLL
jgi:hypothetical protein